ncbi:unnamed protein product [Larinioides sclopetarius]|uniref:Uncharacterized protein n=1 Tax=Larinioides sclopetarius TaxID=280406 RepID=A0AAV2AUE1_9ARAC
MTRLIDKGIRPRLIVGRVCPVRESNDDDQVSEEAPKFEDVQSENVLVPDQLLEEDEITFSIDECSVNADSKEEIENLKRKLNLL